MHCQPPPMARTLLGSLLYTTPARLCSACDECLSAGSCNKAATLVPATPTPRGVDAGMQHRWLPTRTEFGF
eukprot:7083268-Prymnesium_polylepis.1